MNRIFPHRLLSRGSIYLVDDELLVVGETEDAFDSVQMTVMIFLVGEKVVDR